MALYISDGNGNLTKIAGNKSVSNRAMVDASNLTDANVNSFRTKLKLGQSTEILNLTSISTGNKALNGNLSNFTFICIEILASGSDYFHWVVPVAVFKNGNSHCMTTWGSSQTQIKYYNDTTVNILYSSGNSKLKIFGIK